MDNRKLRYLSAIVEHGSMSRAASALSISQPALTKSIKSLQDELGVPLFERKGRRLVPTEYGNLLAEHARTIAIETERTRARLANLRSVAQRRINVGTSPSVIPDIASSAVAAFLRKRPDVAVSVKEALAEDLFELLLAGRIDLMISGLPSYLVSGVTTREILLTDALTAATRVRHPLTRKPRLKLADTLEFGWILPKSNRGIRDLLQDTFLSEGLELPRVAVESDSALFNHALAANSDNIVVISKTSLRTPGGPSLTPLELPGLSWPRRIGLAYRTSAPNDPLISSLVEELRLVARRYEAKR